MCVSVSIMAKGLSGKRTVHEGNAGGKSTLRRFHFYMVSICQPKKKNLMKFIFGSWILLILSNDMYVFFCQTHLGGLWGPLQVTCFGCFYQLVTNNRNVSL